MRESEREMNDNNCNAREDDDHQIKLLLRVETQHQQQRLRGVRGGGMRESERDEITAMMIQMNGENFTRSYSERARCVYKGGLSFVIIERVRE